MRFPMQSFTTTALATAVGVAMGGGYAVADDEANWALEEIIVTAQKREQSLQDVPITISAFSGDFIKDANIKDAKHLSVLTPGVTGDSDDSFLDTINVRGIVTNDYGVGAEPSIGLYQDGVYLGRTGGAVTSFFDIAGVEVVKGPQGTLFGRNSSAGAISMRINKPVQEFEGSVNIGVGQNDFNSFTGVINIPLSDRWAMRSAIYHEEENGWIKNLVGGHDYGSANIDAIRTSFRYTGDKVDATLSLEYEDREQDGTIYNVTNVAGEPQLTAWETPSSRFGVVASDLGNDSVDEADVWGATLTVEYDLSEDYQLTSISAIRGHNYRYLEDYDGSAFSIDHFGQEQDQTYYSQELRLNYNGDGPVTWFVGASVYKEKLEAEVSDTYDEDQQCGFITAAYYAAEYGATYDPSAYNCANYYYSVAYGLSGPGAGQVTESHLVDAEYDGWGVYGDATWHATETIDITVGVRYTEDNRDFGLWMLEDSEHNYPSIYNGAAYTDGYLRASESWDNISPRFAVNWNLDDNLSVYLNLSRGYKAGGFNANDISYRTGVNGFDFYVAQATGGSGDATADAVLTTFDEETVLNYEIGMKSSWWNKRLQFNASIYQYDFKDYQVNFFDEEPNATVVTNAGDAEGSGLEADLHVLPMPNLDIYLGLSLMETELTKVKAAEICETDCTGNTLPGTVEKSYALVATYTLPTEAGDWRLTLENFYQDDFVIDFDGRSTLRGDDFSKINLRLGFESPTGWGAEIYVENLSNEQYYKGGYYHADSVGSSRFGPAKERFVGVDINYDF